MIMTSVVPVLKWRELIGCEEFIGVDLVGGPGVTRVMDAHKLEFSDDLFDLVMCTNTLEHDSDILKTFQEGYRVLKPGGLLLVTTVDENHPEHMEVHPIELPYNHITEHEFVRFITALNPKAWQHFHIDCDMMVRIEK
jgi:ubiquinone/menaquinone biosynthesis C-methylase UbiE